MSSLLLAALALLAIGPIQDSPADLQAALEAARPKLEQALSDETPEGEAWRLAYKERIELLEEQLATVTKHAALSALEDLELRASELEQRMSEARASEPQTELTLTSLDELGGYEQGARTAQAERFSAASAVETLKTRSEDAEEELASLPTRSTRAAARGSDFAGDDPVSSYRQESAALEARVISVRASYLTAALPLWEREDAVLQIALDLGDLLQKRADALAELAQAEASRLREAEAQESRREAAEAERSAQLERDPVARMRLRFQAEAANLRATAKSAETSLKKLGERVIAEREAFDEVQAEHDGLKHRLGQNRRGAETLLRQHLDRSRRAQKLIAETTRLQVEDEYQENQDALAVVLDRMWTLNLPATENTELNQLLDALDAAQHSTATEAFHASLGDDGLEAALEARSAQLSEAGDDFSSLIDFMEQRYAAHELLQDYILGRMLWMPSDPPLNPRTLATGLRELQRLPRPYQQDRTWGRFLESLRSHIPVLLITLAILVAMRWLTKRTAGWREAGTSRTPWVRHSVRWSEALLWAAAPSTALWCLAWGLFAISGPDAFDPPFTTLLIYQGHFMIARRVVRVLLGKDGLIVGPQSFPPAIGAQLVRSVTTLTLAGQAFFAPYQVLSGPPFHFTVVPRIFFTAWSLGASIAVLTLVRRKGALVQTWTLDGGLLRPLLRVLGVFCALMLIPLFTLDVLGFRVGVERTLLNGLKVFSAIFVLGALFRLVEQVGRFWTQRAQRAEDPQEQRLLEARGVAITAVVRLGAYLVAFVGALTLKSALGIGGPLIKGLEGLELLDLGDGRFLTGWNVLSAVLWVVAGHLIAANMRTLYQSLLAPFAGQTTEGNQYAGLAILRYVLLTVAYTGALLNLGFTFATLGLFATAASVGLGFGLQEIVANFISGLILLFERPIRVGDIVTIGSTSGKVESIAIRATVITNWERQTIIVPNKKFITEDLTNWTRTDKVMRRDLTVRVTHGTDVAHVRELLLEVLNGHPAVLKDPAPGVLFQAFGVIGLEFKVLFYTAISDGLSARSEVHARISKKFEEEQIEIPFVRHGEDLPG